MLYLSCIFTSQQKQKEVFVTICILNATFCISFKLAFSLCVSTGVWPQVLKFPRQVLYHLSHVPNLFFFFPQPSFCF
jgi:hypothetical protein